MSGYLMQTFQSVVAGRLASGGTMGFKQFIDMSNMVRPSSTSLFQGEHVSALYLQYDAYTRRDRNGNGSAFGLPCAGAINDRAFVSLHDDVTPCDEFDKIIGPVEVGWAKLAYRRSDRHVYLPAQVIDGYRYTEQKSDFSSHAASFTVQPIDDVLRTGRIMLRGGMGFLSEEVEALDWRAAHLARRGMLVAAKVDAAARTGIDDMGLVEFLAAFPNKGYDPASEASKAMALAEEILEETGTKIGIDGEMAALSAYRLAGELFFSSGDRSAAMDAFRKALALNVCQAILEDKLIMQAVMQVVKG